MRHKFHQGKFVEETAVEAILGWLYEASNPYWEWLWGSPSVALTQLATWVRRPSSEVSASRVTSICESDVFLGGYIALSGSDLQYCRKADLLALLSFLQQNQSEAMMLRIRRAKSLFVSPSEDEFYLSRLGVNPSFRGQGVGHQLVEKYIKDGQKQGFTRFRVNVSGDNEKAIQLYLTAGFLVETEIAIEETSIRYYSMTAIL